MFQTEVVEKIKTHILYSIYIYICIYIRKSCRFRNNVEKYDTARQATDGNIVWCMSSTCWINKATETHSEYVSIIAFPWQNGYSNAPQCDVYTYIVCFVTMDCDRFGRGFLSLTLRSGSYVCASGEV